MFEWLKSLKLKVKFVKELSIYIISIYVLIEIAIFY